MPALYVLLCGDREALVELVDSFLNEAPQRLAELRRGADQGDAGLVGRAPHTLKSNGSTFGAVELASLCRRLEQEHAMPKSRRSAGCDLVPTIASEQGSQTRSPTLQN
ncbi:MAG TPA: Hpt domain-containing protein [Solirubrobacteraceae bacterium]|nr:Hpt domain-containing protein [Solirubrobacteraceae bacterium]